MMHPYKKFLKQRIIMFSFFFSEAEECAIVIIYYFTGVMLS